MLTVGIDIGGKQHAVARARAGQDQAEREVLRVTQDRAGFDEMDRRLLSTIIEKFGGGPVGLDTLGAAITMICVLSERRLNRLTNPALSAGLPPFLTKGAGMFSGLMLSQYTADSLIVEQRMLCTPAAIASIPSRWSAATSVAPTPRLLPPRLPPPTRPRATTPLGAAIPATTRSAPDRGVSPLNTSSITTFAPSGATISMAPTMRRSRSTSCSTSSRRDNGISSPPLAMFIDPS